MKKLGPLLLALLLLFISSTAFASQVPLATKGKYVYISYDTDVSLVSYLASLRVRTGFSSANTSMVLKNNNPEKPITFQMGLPIQIDNVSKIRDLSVRIENKKLKVIERETLENPPSGETINIKNWYVWDMSLDPGEIVVVECAFSIDNKIERNGTEILSFPLHLMEDWSGTIENVQIIADLDFYPAYSFEPNPSIIPAQYDQDGRLTWKFTNIDFFPSDLELSFRPTSVIITNYLNMKFQSSNEIKNILNSYNNKSYYNTIQLIDDFLTSGVLDGVESEVRYIQALCYQELYQLDKALEIFNQLETNPGFGEVLSNTIRNKIIYDKSVIFKTYPNGQEKALEYLASMKSSVKNNEVFVMWLNDEIRRLTPPTVDPEPEEQEDLSNSQEGEEKTSTTDPKEIREINIFGHNFLVEEIALAGLVLLIVIFLIVRSQKKNKRSRYSMFK